MTYLSARKKMTKVIESFIDGSYSISKNAVNYNMTVLFDDDISQKERIIRYIGSTTNRRYSKVVESLRMAGISKQLLEDVIYNKYLDTSPHRQPNTTIRVIKMNDTLVYIKESLYIDISEIINILNRCSNQNELKELIHQEFGVSIGTQSMKAILSRIKSRLNISNNTHIIGKDIAIPSNKCT